MIVKAIIGIILVYRLIPKRIRRIWSFGDSTSHLALAGFRSGQVHGLTALSAFLSMAIPHKVNIDHQFYSHRWLDTGRVGIEKKWFKYPWETGVNIDARWRLWPQLPGSD